MTTEIQALIDTDALKLRSKGYTYQKIADTMGCSKPTAYERVKRALAAIPAEAVEEYRRLEGERLDTLLEMALKKAQSEDKGFLFAIDRCLAIMDRRAKLYGLDAPIRSQVEVTTYEGGSELDRELQRLITEHARLTGGGGEIPVGQPSGETGPDTA